MNLFKESAFLQEWIPEGQYQCCKDPGNPFPSFSQILLREMSMLERKQRWLFLPLFSFILLYSLYPPTFLQALSTGPDHTVTTLALLPRINMKVVWTQVIIFDPHQVIILIVFFVCWFPFFLTYVLAYVAKVIIIFIMSPRSLNHQLFRLSLSEGSTQALAWSGFCTRSNVLAEAIKWSFHFHNYHHILCRWTFPKVGSFSFSGSATPTPPSTPSSMQVGGKCLF